MLSKFNTRQKNKILLGLAIFLFIFVGCAFLFVQWKNSNNVLRDFHGNNYLPSQKPIENYIKTQNEIHRVFTGKNIQAHHEKNNFIKQCSAAAVSSPEKSVKELPPPKSIARGLSTFVSIGDKDTSKVVEKTNEELAYIQQAQLKLKILMRETEAFKEKNKDRPDNEESSVLDLIHNNYESLDSFFRELLLYKQFFKKQLDAIDVQKINNQNQGMIELLQNFAKSASSISSPDKFFNEHTSEFVASLENKNNTYEKAIKNLEEMEAPKEALDYELLKEMKKARIQYYSKRASFNKETIRSLEEGNSLLSTMKQINKKRVEEGEKISTSS